MEGGREKLMYTMNNSMKLNNKYVPPHFQGIMSTSSLVKYWNIEIQTKFE